MARRRQVSGGARRVRAAGRGWQETPHRVGGGVAASAVATELSWAPRLAAPATQAARREARRDPGSRLLGVGGCSAISAGWDSGGGWLGDSRLSGFCRKPPTAWSAVSTAPCREASRVSEGKGTARCGRSLSQTPGRASHRA